MYSISRLNRVCTHTVTCAVMHVHNLCVIPVQILKVCVHLYLLIYTWYPWCVCTQATCIKCMYLYIQPVHDMLYYIHDMYVHKFVCTCTQTKYQGTVVVTVTRHTNDFTVKYVLLTNNTPPNNEINKEPLQRHHPPCGVTT